MEKNEKSKNLRVSDCHHAGYAKVQVMNEKTKEFEDTWNEICDVCRQPCKVVEMIVDSIQASEEE